MNYHGELELELEIIKTIINNCSINKTFYKFITLCSNLHIHIFSYRNGNFILKRNHHLVSICKKMKEDIIKKYSYSIAEISQSSIDSEKKIIEINGKHKLLNDRIMNLDDLIYMLEEIYNDETLTRMCYYYKKPEIKLFIAEYGNYVK